MTALPKPALLDAAARAGRVRPEDYVWHLVMHREGRPAATGERLATLALPESEVAAIGRRAMRAAGILTTDTRDALTVGLRELRRALDAERLRWRRLTMRAGYVEGWAVAVVAERGYRRSVFPGASLGAIGSARTALTLPGGSTP